MIENCRPSAPRHITSELIVWPERERDDQELQSVLGQPWTSLLVSGAPPPRQAQVKLSSVIVTALDTASLPQ